MKPFLISLIFLFFISCNEDHILRTAAYIKLVGNFEQNTKLEMLGITEGVNHDTGKYNLLGVSFKVDDLCDINTSRKMIVTTINDFLLTLNSSSGFEQFFDKYPFPSGSLRISVISKNKSSEINSVTVFNDEITYYHDCDDLVGPNFEYRKIHTETFDQAVKILTGPEST